jgi:hypothetical protein
MGRLEYVAVMAGVLIAAVLMLRWVGADISAMTHPKVAEAPLRGAQ